MPTREQLDAAYEAAMTADELICKALEVSEVAQIASSETRLRDFCIARWETLAKKAVQEAVRLTLDWAGPEVIAEAVHQIMLNWALEVSPSFLKELDRVYRLARIAGFKKAKGLTNEPLTYDTPSVEQVQKAADAEFKVVFDLVDEQAVAALQTNNLFWIGEHYGKNVSESVANTASETLVQAGSSRKEAAVAMEKAMSTALKSFHVPGGYSGSARGYIEGLVANAMTTGRVQGQIRSFVNVGITTYELVNPVDERTCPICAHMAGKVFTVKQASDQIELVQSASSPDQVKAIHPWLTVSEMKAISPLPGHQGPADSTALALAGFQLPPFHFRCRCTVDVSEFSESFEALE
jgi:SPP1 gp7 family putative phage head morphogenesis protein